MSDEHSNDLNPSSVSSGEAQQTEGVRHSAAIIHADGTREAVQIEAQRLWSGVLPRPEDFAKYAEKVPDAPERLLRMAEKEQDHRIYLERQIVPANNRLALTGQWLGWSLSLIALCLAVYLSKIGAPWQLSATLVGLPVLSVAGKLVSAFRSEADD